MPDVHAGKGATVGSVIAMKGAVAPSAVGVDIGCGMGAVKLNLTKEELGDLAVIRQEIEAAVPVGFNSHDHARLAFWSQANVSMMGAFFTLPKSVQTHEARARQQLGTLGGGNHFIEICEAKDGSIWLMLHSGSRYIGKEIAEHHVRIAKAQEHNHVAEVTDRELSVLLAGTTEYQNYLNDLEWAQDYAYANREVMFRLILEKVLRERFGRDVQDGDFILCHHNYASIEVHDGEQLVVTRKGAIQAKKDQLGIIPGSMGTRSYIVRGLGNEASLMSASHGAGRTMSRSKAKKTFTVEDVKAQTAGVECRKDAGIIDEIPGAYKDIDQVMERQKDLVEVVTEIKALLCIKG
jgi:tRNA-splicing ligase RtcB